MHKSNDTSRCHYNILQRPKISVYIALSIDGYIARQDHRLDWLDRVGGFDDDYGFQKFLESIDTIIIGRKTYEVASTASDPYPGKRVIVVSKTLSSVHAHIELYSGELSTVIQQLHTEGSQHIWVDGGSIISQFLALNLVDEITISIIPVMLGSGIPLFHSFDREISYRLLSFQSYKSGLAQLHYETIRHFTAEKDALHFTVIEHGTEEYAQAVALREEVLRKPLGLFFTQEELEQEKKHVHIAGFLGKELCATAALVPDESALQMQRVAVKPQFHHMGIGSHLLAFCEKYARKYNFKSIYCHARDTAVSFYLKNTYACEEKPFIENGIPHQKMRKYL